MKLQVKIFLKDFIKTIEFIGDINFISFIKKILKVFIIR